MARIRTIKPEFFRHEALQDLEIAHPGMYPMLVFEGLWGHCDSRGRFEWRPRQLKLDILPFLPFDMAQTLDILSKAGQVEKYEVDGKEYGLIPSFEKHQRITGKEATEGEKYPGMDWETTGKQSGNTGEGPVAQEWKGIGKEKEGNGSTTRAVPQPSQNKPATASRFDPGAFLIDKGVTEPVCRDWLALRKQKRAPVTETAINGIVREAQAAGMTLDAVLALCCQRGWQGFKAEWVQDGKNGSAYKTVGQERAQVAAALAGSQPPDPGGHQVQGNLIEGEARRVA